MTGFIADLRHAVRIYVATPVSSFIALVVLAVAMACVSSFLSLFSDLVLKPHPGFERATELITIGRSTRNNFSPFSKDMLDRVRDDIPALESITGVSFFFPVSLEPGGEEQSIEYIERNFFPTMRPRLQLGRGFEAADHEAGAEPVTIIANRYWLEYFGGRTDAIGQTVRVTGTPLLRRFNPEGENPEPEEQSVDYRIVGVMAASYTGTFADTTVLWLPLEQAGPLFMGDESSLREASLLYPLARLEGGARVEPIVTELNGRYGEMTREFQLAPGMRIDAIPGIVRDLNVHRDTERQVRLLLAGGVLLALVAAANVSLFLLSRAPGRRRELGVRMAVGAPLRRLARQLATEAGLLVVTATFVGLLVSAWFNVLLQDLSFLQRAQWRDVSLDWRVLVLVAGLTVVLTALVSLGPVLGLKRLGIAASSRSISARPGLTQHLAGNLQIAAACILGGVAVGFSWYLGLLVFGERGYASDDLHLVSMQQQRGPRAFDQVDFDAILAERSRRRQALLALPGIEEVAFGTSVPGRTSFALIARFPKPDAPDEEVQFRLISCDPGYIGLLGFEVISGAGLEDLDVGGVLINETLARQFWGRADVVGEVFPAGFGGREQTEVIGVLADVPFGHPSAEVEPLAFAFLTPFTDAESILIRSRMPSAEVRTALQGAIDDGDLEVEIANVEPLTSIADGLIAADRARTVVAVATALLVVVLAAFGFYGTQRFLVAAGRREYAIRSALGAGPRAIGRLVLARALVLGAPGLAFGGVLAFIALTWLHENFLPEGVSSLVVTVGVVAVVGLLLLASALGPARNARRTDAGPLLKQD